MPACCSALTAHSVSHTVSCISCYPKCAARQKQTYIHLHVRHVQHPSPSGIQASALARQKGAAPPACKGSLTSSASSAHTAWSTGVQGHCLARAQVSRTFEVEGVGSVVLGTVLQGYVSVGQQLILVRLLVPCFNLLRS